MTEEQYKFLSKLAIENGQTKLTDLQKEALKQCVDKAQNVEELVAILITALTN